MNTNQSPNQKGFTLLELMVVVGIMGILSAVAIPSYNNYVVKAQVTEAFVLMDNVKTASLLEYQETGRWPVSINAEGSEYYVSVISETGNTIMATISKNASPIIAGSSVTWQYSDPVTGGNGGWYCSTTLPYFATPFSCRAVTADAIAPEPSIIMLLYFGLISFALAV